MSTPDNPAGKQPDFGIYKWVGVVYLVAMATKTERTTEANGVRITRRVIDGESAMARRAAAALPRADERVARVSQRGGKVTVWLDTPDDEPFSFERPDGWTAPEQTSPMIVTSNGTTGVRMVPEGGD